MERTPKILVVDDDPRLRDLLRRYLGENGFQVFVSENGAAMNRIWMREHFDALILDLMMPGEDGLQILRRLRAAKDMTPIIMLTARGEDVDRIVGLELGADDYITKPYSARELTARVKALLRRANADNSNSEPKENTGIITSGDVTINVDRYEVKKNGKTLDITLREFELLKFLAEAPDQIFSREVLLENVWGYEYLGDVRTVDVTIRRLREKIEDDPSMPRYIITKRSIGYYFNKI